MDDNHPIKLFTFRRKYLMFSNFKREKVGKLRACTTLKNNKKNQKTVCTKDFKSIIGLVRQTIFEH